MNIKVLASAEKDIAAGSDFYDLQKDHLGDYFLDSIFADIDSLYIYAGIHMQIDGYYRLLAKRFPFAIYYKINKETVYVYAVLDCRREPSMLPIRL